MRKGFSIFKTRMGWCGFAVGDKGVLGMILPVQGKNRAHELIEERWPGGKFSSSVHETIKEELERYFAGERVVFSFPLDFSGCSPFARLVYEAAMAIPYGEVRSYGWVCGAAGRPGASRAVGRAMGRNPFPPVVPCHRVVKGDGTLGGFSAEMGLPLKLRMLKMEGVDVLDGNRVMEGRS
jgi:methylated-DNA-[protein]-cysteine S-methyltransferase